ncbi:MAG: SdrD B-like domain-containing protein, partial [Actinomycetota bacterium]
MYVPLAEQEISDGLFSIFPAGASAADDVVSTISITASAAGALIYWDHWEDGYEADLTMPVSATTEVWGDGVAANGMRPGAADATEDVIDLGEVIFLQDAVELPRDPDQIFFDGNDKVASTRGFSMTRAGWDAGIGPAHAGAVAATDTSKYGTRFDIPIGEDAGFEAFDYTGLSVLVAADDTMIDIDLGGDGTIDRTETVDEGQSIYVDGGVDVGTTVRTTKPAQVHLITGERDSRYEGRWYEVFPAETLDDEYVAAAGSLDTVQRVTTFVFNPSDDPITVAVDAVGTSGDTDLVVPGREVARYDIPNGSGAHFASPGNQFSVASGTVAVVGSSVAYDWGYTLVPVSSLTPSVFVGWGAGSPTGNASNSPVWAAPLAPTTIFVDLDADGAVDQTFTDVDAYESVRIVDPDHDLTGANVFTTDGTPLSVAWGQDAALQASNAFDLGAAVLPTASLVTTKEAVLVGDANGDGVVDPGDTLRYTIRNFDAGALALTDLTVVDDLPVTLAYVADSTTVDGVPLADDTSGTPFPLDGAGSIFPLLQPGGSFDVVFEAMVAPAFPFFVDTVTNTATVTATQATSTATSITAVRPIEPASIGDLVWLDADGDGTSDAGEPGIDGLTVALVGPSHPTGTTTATADGAYRFDDLVPGDYVVTIDRSAASALPATSYRTSGTDSLAVTVSSGETVDTADFGYVVPPSVSGLLFNDLGADGSID